MVKIIKQEYQCFDIISQYDDAHIIDNGSETKFIGYTMDEEEVNDKMQRPIYLGNLIYAHAREYMYDLCIHPYDSISYQDTDSACIDYDDYQKFIRTNPNLILHNDVKKVLTKDDYDQYIKEYPNVINRNDK